MMTPWPRRIINFPIIMIAVVQEFVWAGALIWDKSTLSVTAVSIFSHFAGWPYLAIFLTATALFAIAGFFMVRRRDTLLALLPQQFVLYLSAGSAIEAIYKGHFADGTIRTSAFLLADQCPAFLLAFFHTWAMMLILQYGEDANVE